MKVSLTKHRKMLVLLPFLILPILVLIYFAGKYYQGNSINIPADSLSRLNIKFPEPDIKDKQLNKLEIYMQMQKDSLEKLREDKKQIDSRFTSDPISDPYNDYLSVQHKSPDQKNLAQQEARVNDQLEKIMKELNNVSEKDNPRNTDYVPASSQEIQPNSDIEHLEKLLASVQTDTSEDPELKQLDAMLDKIIQIQQPQSSNIQSKKETNISPGMVVNKQLESIPKSSLFYGLKQPSSGVSTQKPAIKAVVHTDQTVQDGSTIKLRLTENIYVAGQLIPANSFVYGICGISDERLTIQLNRIVSNNSILPVQLEVYDTDGIVGISIPGAITRDGAKKGLDNTLQTLSMTNLDPSMAAQATSAGIQSLKSLLSRKIKLVKVNVKAGHQVYLQ